MSQAPLGNERIKRVIAKLVDSILRDLMLYTAEVGVCLIVICYSLAKPGKEGEVE
jgi:hypothetical protein